MDQPLLGDDSATSSKNLQERGKPVLGDSLSRTGQNVEAGGIGANGVSFSPTGGSGSMAKGAEPSSAAAAAGSSIGGKNTGDCVLDMEGLGLNSPIANKDQRHADEKKAAGESRGWLIFRKLLSPFGQRTNTGVADETAAAGDAARESRSWFMFRKLRSPSGKRTNTGITDSKRDECKAMIESAIRLSEHWSHHSTFAKSAARLADALRSFADAANKKSEATAAMEVEAAASALTKAAAAASGKIQADAATIANKIASDSASMVAKANRPDPNETEAWLFCISIPGALALLPYLRTDIPENLKICVAWLFGIVFSAASAGAMLSVRATEKRDVWVTAVLSRVSFTAFSLLVVVFVAAALASCNPWLIGGCAFFVMLGHVYSWSR